MADEKDSEAGQPTGGSKKKLFIIIGAVLVLALAGGGAFLFLGGDSGEEGAEGAEVAEAPKEAIYVAIDPAFTVNLEGASRAKYLQISVEAMTRDPDVEDAIRENLPLVRNELMMLFSSKTSQELTTAEGKEQLRQDTLDTVGKVVNDSTGKELVVETIFFTGFVMQ